MSGDTERLVCWGAVVKAGFQGRLRRSRVEGEDGPSYAFGDGAKSQGEYVASLGQELGEEREAKGLSREEVAHSLDVQPHYIAAIEEGSSRLVADPFYLVPFLRRYAEFLGWDPGQAVGRYLAEVGRRERQGAPQRNSLPAVPRIWLLRVAGVLLILAFSLWFLVF